MSSVTRKRDAEKHSGDRYLLSSAPELIQYPLPHLERPMMTRLMHDRTDLPILFPIIKHIPHTTGYVFLQQHSLPSPTWADTSCPPPHLPFIIITPPSLEETTVPLKPPAGVIGVVYPTRSLPLFDRLAARNPVFVRCGVVWSVEEVAFYV